MIPYVRGAALWLLLAVGAACGTARSAEFDLDEGRVVLRRIQYCDDCGAALLVARVHPGALIHCPDCGREQPRLADRYLLTRVYQLCRLCEAPLAVDGLAPGETAACATCHTRQILSRDAFPTGEAVGGLGYVPGFPPGSGKKTLLYSPDRPDSLITPIPLDEDAGPALAMTGLPLPDLAPPSPRRWETPSLPTVMPPAPPPATPPALPPATETDAAEARAHAAAAKTAAVEVPALTAETFARSAKTTETTAAKSAPEGAALSAGSVLARVDGMPIYTKDVERILTPIAARLREKTGQGDAAGAAVREEELRRRILDGLIDRELAFRELAREGFRPDAATLREREAEATRLFALGGGEARREAERDAAMAEARRRCAADPGAIGPEAVRDYYKSHAEALRRPRLLALEQMVVYEDRSGQSDRRDFRTIAEEISRELEKGARFDALRNRYDEFAAVAGIAGLEAALAPEGSYGATVLAAGGDLRRGAVFGPVFLEGMAVFAKVADERAAGPAPFEEVEKEIRARLASEAAEAKLAAWLKGLRRAASVVEVR